MRISPSAPLFLAATALSAPLTVVVAATSDRADPSSGVFLRATSSSFGSSSSSSSSPNPDSDLVVPNGDKAERRGRSLAAIPGCPGSDGDFTVTFTAACNYASLRSAVDSIKDAATCTAAADDVLLALLGETNSTVASSAVRDLCREAYSATSETFPFSSISKKGQQFDNEYYSGGTIWNYEVENDDGHHVLKDDAARVGRVFSDQAQRKVIDLPEYLESFDPDGDGCDLNAAFCCWVQDRQAGDNNGNCNTPYDSQCIDRDPGDNTNFCYTDHSRSSAANHVSGGFSVFGNVLNGQENIEGSVHCHGFAWAQDDTDISSVYRGNNLFFVSMYDHMHQRGYVRNAPGSAMCACAENMAVVTRADCTEIAATETFSFTYSSSTSSFSGVLAEVNDVDFNACQGANGNNNDLDAYYEQLVIDGKQTQSNLNALREILVGTQAGQCNAAIEGFMQTKGIVRKGAAMAAEGMIAEGDAPMAEAEATPSTGETVEEIDIAYEKASGGGDGQSMPAVPTDQEAEYGGGEEDQDAAAPNPVVVVEEPVEAEDSEFSTAGERETEEGSTTTLSPTLKGAGESCDAGYECLSGKCLGRGECAEVKKGGGGNGSREQDAAAEEDEPPACVPEGGACRNEGQCCEGACEGKGNDKTCTAYDVLD